MPERSLQESVRLPICSWPGPHVEELQLLAREMCSKASLGKCMHNPAVSERSDDQNRNVELHGACKGCAEELQYLFLLRERAPNEWHIRRIEKCLQGAPGLFHRVQLLPPEPDFQGIEVVVQGEFLADVQARLGPYAQWVHVRPLTDAEFHTELGLDVRRRLANLPTLVEIEGSEIAVQGEYLDEVRSRLACFGRLVSVRALQLDEYQDLIVEEIKEDVILEEHIPTLLRFERVAPEPGFCGLRVAVQGEFVGDVLFLQDRFPVRIRPLTKEEYLAEKAHAGQAA